MFKKLTSPLTQAMEAVSQKHGFACHELITKWNVIAGRNVASLGFPLSISFNSYSQKSEGVLIIGVSHPSFSLELQAMEKLIVDRVCAYFGYPLIRKIKVRSVSINSPTPPLPKHEIEKQYLGKDESLELKRKVDNIPNEDLKSVLTRLAEQIFE